jgi:hypothetical protein
MLDQGSITKVFKYKEERDFWERKVAVEAVHGRLEAKKLSGCVTR